MAQKFVPVDLDKLLDDFEEQDSAPISDEVFTSIESQNESIQASRFKSDIPRSNVALTSSHQDSQLSVLRAGLENAHSSSLPKNNRKEQKEIDKYGLDSDSSSLCERSQISQRLFSQTVDIVPNNKIGGNVSSQNQSVIRTSQDYSDEQSLKVSHETDSTNLSCGGDTDSTPLKLNNQSSSKLDGKYHHATDLKYLSLEKHIVSDFHENESKHDIKCATSVSKNSCDYGNLLCTHDTVVNSTECSTICTAASENSSRCTTDKQITDVVQNERGPQELLLDKHFKEKTKPEEIAAVDRTVSLLDDVGQEACASQSEKTFNMVTTRDPVVCIDKISTKASTQSKEPTTEETSPSLYFLRDHFSQFEVSDEQGNDQGQHNIPGFSSQTNINEPISDPSAGHLIPVAQVVTEPATPIRSNNDLGISEPFQLGYTPPQWMPDNEASRCANCDCKFTMVRRRHHCRACGKVFCAACCNLKFNLHYMQDKLARVCQACANTLLQRQAALNNQDASLSNNDESPMYLYLSPERQTIPDAQEVQPSPVFSETEESNPFYYDSMPDEVSPTSNSVPLLPENVVATDDSFQITQFRQVTCSSSSSLSSADVPVTSTVPLPPVLKKSTEGLKIDNAPNHQEILYLLKKKKETVSFLLNKNLIVKVKIVKLNCCVKRKCWCFSSEGMGAADQEDIVILLEYVSKESIPHDVLSHFNTAFAYAKQGHRVTDLGYTIFGQPFLGSLRNAGFLYIKPSFQCLENLVLPSGPHIFGILIQREEVSWVQLFPIRLILRLGAEYRYYPCPLWSVRDREALYGEVGHTIMDLLADFKNFQYTLPRVTGMHVHLEDKKTIIQLPQTRYDEVVKVLNATDEYVMAFEATFSNVADSHLVCIQEGTGYKTQAINIEGYERKVTGVSFVVFNGALKSTNDIKAKVSIVEDGVMVQMVMQLSQEMRQAMREMKDFTINTGGPSDGGAIQEVVIEWVTKKSSDSEIILSPIDGLALGTTTDIKINTHFDYSTPGIYRLRWSQLFFLDQTEERPRNLSQHFKETTADIAKGCTLALRPHLASLAASGKHRIGLRVNLSPDMVGYTIGCQGAPLRDGMMAVLDNELVPAVHNAVNPSSNAPTAMEFVFDIIEILS